MLTEDRSIYLSFFLSTRKEREVSQIGSSFQRGFLIYLCVKAVGEGEKNKVKL